MELSNSLAKKVGIIYNYLYVIYKGGMKCL